MKSQTVPLAMPQDLLGQVRHAAKRTKLSMADVMRQSMQLGLPKLIERLSTNEALKPLTPEECRQAWEVPDPEFDALAAHCAKLAPPSPEQ